MLITMEQAVKFVKGETDEELGRPDFVCMYDIVSAISSRRCYEAYYDQRQFMYPPLTRNIRMLVVNGWSTIGGIKWVKEIESEIKRDGATL